MTFYRVAGSVVAVLGCVLGFLSILPFVGQVDGSRWLTFPLAVAFLVVSAAIVFAGVQVARKDGHW